MFEATRTLWRLLLLFKQELNKNEPKPYIKDIFLSIFLIDGFDFCDDWTEL